MALIGSSPPARRPDRCPDGLVRRVDDVLAAIDAALADIDGARLTAVRATKGRLDR